MSPAPSSPMPRPWQRHLPSCHRACADPLAAPVAQDTLPRNPSAGSCRDPPEPLAAQGAAGSLWLDTGNSSLYLSPSPLQRHSLLFSLFQNLFHSLATAAFREGPGSANMARGSRGPWLKVGSRVREKGQENMEKAEASNCVRGIFDYFTFCE